MIRIAGDTRAKIALFAADTPLDKATTEVTINGGVADPYPPLLTAIREQARPGQVSLEAIGSNLADISRGALVADETHSTIELEITSRTASVVTLRHLSTSTALPRGRLEISDANGMTGALPFEPGAILPAADYANDHFLIRFASGAATPPQGATAGQLGEFGFSPASLAGALAAAGVTRLERLFPWFHSEDVQGTNSAGEPAQLENLADVYVARVAEGVDASTAHVSLRVQSGVLYAEPDVLVSAHFTPNDSLFSAQWGLHNTGQGSCQRPNIAGIDIDAPAAWDQTLGSSDVSIAILDTGIDNTHVELSARAVLDTSFVAFTSAFDDHPNRHGTAVAGIAAAAINNGPNSITGIAGVAPQSVPHAIKVLDYKGDGLISEIAQGIDWARLRSYPIINMSLGTKGVVSDTNLNTLQMACLNAYLSGSLIVASSGNLEYGCCDPQGHSFEVPYLTFPVGFSRRVLGVGAVTAIFPPGPRRWADRSIWETFCDHPLQSGLCNGSNYWIPSMSIEPFVDLVAPGGRFITTTKAGPNSYHDLTTCTFNTNPNPATGYLGFSGTSAAAPVVSGAAALLRSRFGYLLGDELEHVLTVTASSDGLPFTGKPHDEYGWGMVKPDSAIKYLSSPRVLTRGVVAGPSLSIDSTTNVLMFFENVPGVPSSGIACTRYRLRGKVNFSFYTSTPDVWVRGSGSAGASDTNHYNAWYVVPWGRVFQVSQASCSLVTFTYRVPNYGWVPVDPSHAAIAWSAVGPTNVVGVGVTAPVSSFALRASPNPVAATARISLDLPERGLTNVSVIDLGGRIVARVTTGVLDGGPHKFRWDGRDVRGHACPAGVYFVRAEHRGRGLTKRLVLLQGGHR